MSTASNIYFSEFERLKTFQENGWPHSFLSPEVMAKCGFYYTGINDDVKCPFCNVVVFNWSNGDEPIREHIRASGRCRFVNGYDVGNIFIGDDPREIFDLTPGEDVCGLFTPKNTESKQIETNEPGIPYYEPSHLDYVTYDSRLASYKDWTSELIAPTKLAEAGFFFRGLGIAAGGDEIKDAVTCFHCGESLSGWTENDNAWEEHAKFSPKCSFIFLITAFETSKMHQNTISSTFLPYSWLPKATDENRCSVCFEFAVSISFSPCAHKACPICAAALIKCPICRANIRSLTKLSQEPSSIESPSLEPPPVVESPPAVESPSVVESSPVVESTAVVESPPVVESPSVVESPPMKPATLKSAEEKMPKTEKQSKVTIELTKQSSQSSP